MVTGVLADVNIQGHVDYLMSIVRSAAWGDLWQELALTYSAFDDVGLAPDAADDEIWQCCQDGGYVLITNNRNRDRNTSLESVIRARNTERSLPVFTIADTERLRHSREYGQRVAEALIDTLMRIETLLGTGRLYLP